MDQFPVKLPIRIDWSEMDLFGHVNNVAYFKYIQASRVNYWEVSGLDAMFKENKIGPILLSTGCTFLKPLFYPGNIVLEARIEFIKNTSFGLHHRILNEQNEVAAEAHDVIVTFDFNRNEKVLVPDRFRQAAEKIEGKSFTVIS
jgi:acyl-CoA thioester hydrolase